MSKIAWIVAMLAAVTTAIVAIVVTDRRGPAAAPPPHESRVPSTFGGSLTKPNIHQLKAGYHQFSRASVPSAASAWDSDRVSATGFRPSAPPVSQDNPRDR